MNRPVAALAAGTMLLLAVPLVAQEAPRALGLDEAIRIAEERNPDYQRARAELEVAAADVRAGWGAYLPDLSLSMSTGGGISRVMTGLDPFGRPERLDDPLTFRGSTASQSISLGSITLFDGGRRRHELHSARASERATVAQVEAERNRLAAEVGRRYREAQRAERQVALEMEALEATREREEMARRLLQLAVNSPLDVAGAEVAVAEQEMAVQRARGEVRKAMLALRETLGWMDETPLALTEPVPDPFDPAGLDAATLVSRAHATSPALVQREESLEAVERSVRAADAGRWPQIGTFASFSRSVRAEEFHALFEPNPLDQSFSFGFSLQLPVFTQFRTSASLARARAQRLGAERDLTAARLTVEREVRAALIDLENAHESYLVAQRVAELNRDRVEMAEQQYRIGAIDFKDLQDVVERSDEAERQVLGARFEFAAALVTLEERVGMTRQGMLDG
jgi:outer membrane protein